MSNKQLKSTGLPTNYVSKLSSFSIVTVKVGMNDKESSLFGLANYEIGRHFVLV